MLHALVDRRFDRSPDHDLLFWPLTQLFF